MTKPNVVPVRAANIPHELQVLNRWVLWRYEQRDGSWRKMPRQVGGAAASVADETTWYSFGEVRAELSQGDYDGLGLILPDGVVGVDLDDCRDPETGVLNEQAQMVMSLLPSYTEVSPSGTGVKTMVFGHLNHHMRNVCHQRGVEMYDGGSTQRYFALTGNMITPGFEKLRGGRDGLFALQSLLTDPLAPPSAVDALAEPERATKAIACLQHLAEGRADDYQTWIQVGMALSWCDPSEDMLDHFIRWSLQSPKSMGEDECRSKWASFKREQGRLVTLGYLQRLALEDGYDPDKYQTGAVTGTQLLNMEIHRTYIVENFLVQNEPMVIGGATKALKTTVALDLALSVATGTPFMGVFNVLNPQKVMLISGESGEATLQETLSTMAAARGLTPAALSELHVGFKLPKLDDIKHVVNLIDEIRGSEIMVVIIDPLYRSLRAGDSASNVYRMGEQLDLIAEHIHTAGVTPILLHHLRKQGTFTYNDPPELEDLSQAGIAEFGRQFLLLKRRHGYENNGKHDLYFRWGGSAGHQGSKMLEAYTGTRELGMDWKVTLRTEEEYKERKKALLASKREEDREERQTLLRELVLEAIEKNPGAQNRHLYASIPAGKNAIQNTITQLVDCGDVMRVRSGRQIFYTLPGGSVDPKLMMTDNEATIIEVLELARAEGNGDSAGMTQAEIARVGDLNAKRISGWVRKLAEIGLVCVEEKDGSKFVTLARGF